MKTIMFYSYKGGSGRTVAAANVSAALAKLGKRVAAIDLDFEAPGLHYVFEAEETRQFKNSKGIQHYLKGEIRLEEMEKDVCIDMFSPDGPLSGCKAPEGALLLYIMASPNVTLVDTKEPQVIARLHRLIESLASAHQLDYVIIDSASGMRYSYSMAADVSDEMLIFFRWSMQHVQGTLRIARYIAIMNENEYGQRVVPFKLVASATTTKSELDGLDLDPKTRDELIADRDGMHSKIEQALRERHVTPAQIFYDIPEMIDLKWKERVTVFSPGPVTEFEKLASKLVDMDSGERI